MKCPYCGCENDTQATHCKKCKAGLPHESNVDKPVKAENVPKRRVNKNGT